jgi:hypothetical protein
METHLEKRKCRRYKARLRLQAEFAGLPGALAGETVDISSQGAFFLIPRTEPLQLGGRVALEILMPEDYAFAGQSGKQRVFRIIASGTVVRLFHDAEMDQTRVAVSFSRHRLVRDGEPANEQAGAPLSTETELSQESTPAGTLETALASSLHSS